MKRRLIPVPDGVSIEQIDIPLVDAQRACRRVCFYGYVAGMLFASALWFTAWVLFR